MPTDNYLARKLLHDALREDEVMRGDFHREKQLDDALMRELGLLPEKYDAEERRKPRRDAE